MPDSAPVLEVNPNHALLKRLEGETDDARAADLALLLLEQAQVSEGAQLDDPAAFVQRLNRVILGGVVEAGAATGGSSD
jgi:molecular chaperone HtpG